MATPAKVSCPKCNRTLVQSGEISFGGKTFPTFQCDECIVNAEFLGVATEVALTFAVDQNGRCFDPAEPDQELKL